MPARGRRFRERLVGWLSDDLTATCIKATDSSPFPPKTKHLQMLIALSKHPDVSISTMTQYLLQRASNAPTTALFLKALSVIHYLLSRAHQTFFASVSTVQTTALDRVRLDSDAGMREFTRTYREYLKGRFLHCRQVGIDICWHNYRIPGEIDLGRPVKLNNSIKRVMEAQDVLDALLRCSCQFIFRLMLVDARAILKKISPLQSNLAESFFDLPKSEAQLCLQSYEHFYDICVRLDEMFQLAKSSGTADVLNQVDLQSGPAKLLPLMRQHVRNYYHRVSSRKGVSDDNYLPTASDSKSPHIALTKPKVVFDMSALTAQATPYRPLPREEVMHHNQRLQFPSKEEMPTDNVEAFKRVHTPFFEDE
eukprot:gene4149-8468_t